MDNTDPQLARHIDALLDLQDSPGWRLLCECAEAETKRTSDTCTTVLPSTPEAVARIAHAQGKLEALRALVEMPQVLIDSLQAERDAQAAPESTTPSEGEWQYPPHTGRLTV